MPVEMIVNLPLLSLDEPFSHSKEIITHIFTEVKGFKDLFSIELLLVGGHIHHHRAFT
jgi:hypothetical protein